MSSPLFIALRFISHRKKSIFISLAGTILGVAFFISTQAQTQGFEKFYIQTVLGSWGAILVQDRFQPRYSAFADANSAAVLNLRNEKPRKYYLGVNNPERVMRVIREFSNVIACAPMLEENVTIENDFRSVIMRLQGIDLEAHLQTTELRKQTIAGDLADFRLRSDGLLLGSLLAGRLQANPGDTVRLIAAGGESRSFVVCGIVETGDNLTDERRGLIHLKAAQSFVNKPSAISMIIVRLRDPDRAPELAAHLEQLLQHRARSWQEREKGVLQIFNCLRVSAAITVSAIIVLAGFGIFNVLTLMILDKVREIAILRSMGYRRSDISAIFLWQGFFVASVGSIAGCGLGALLTWLISKWHVQIRGFFAIDYFPVDWRWEHYLGGVVVAFVAILLASYFPARRAANLAPVAILRGASM